MTGRATHPAWPQRLWAAWITHLNRKDTIARAARRVHQERSR